MAALSCDWDERAHDGNVTVDASRPTPAALQTHHIYHIIHCAPVVQLVEASDLGSECWGFESLLAHQSQHSLACESARRRRQPVTLEMRGSFPLQVAKHAALV